MLPNSVDLGQITSKWLMIDPLSATEKQSKESSFVQYVAILAEVSENEFVREAPPVKSSNLINTVPYLANGATYNTQ